MSFTSSDIPQLAPPGAGLPAYELQIARLLFALRAWTHDARRTNALSWREQSLIAELIRGCPAGRLKPIACPSRHS
jgi:hypothetical protein